MPSQSKNKKAVVSAKELVQIKGNKNQISKEQQSFNKLTKRIDYLQKSLATITEKLNALNQIYQQDVFSKVLEMGRLKIRLSHLLHTKRDLIKLSNAQKQKLDSVIFSLLDDAFTVIAPDEESKKIFDAYSDTSFDDELSTQEDELGEIMADMFFNQFGLKLDPSMLKGNDADFKTITDDLRRQLEQQENNKKTRKKTKKQLEKEALAEQKDALKKKSLRSIYLSLAKILHPDTERDETLKKEKEETMKKVTSAYEKNDMAQLLQIEMQWVKTHEDLLAGIDVDTVKVYIELLKDQVAQLEMELEMIHLNPTFSQVSGYWAVTDQQAEDDIRHKSLMYEQLNREMAGHIKNLEQSKLPSSAIKQCILEYYDDDEDDNFSF